MKTKRLTHDHWKTNGGGTVKRVRRVGMPSEWFFNKLLIGEGGKARRKAFRLMRSAASLATKPA